MSRLAISTGTPLSLTLLADWPINVTAADLSGNVSLSLPGSGNVSYNRPVSVYAVYYPGALPPGITPAALIAQSAVGQGVVPPPDSNPATAVTLTVVAPLPLPTGTVTVVAVGEFTE